MSEPPEFPQESPAMRYVVDQVSKIEDAHACSDGYYRSLGKVLARLDKTDIALSQLRQVTESLKKMADPNTFTFILERKSDEINQTLRENLDLINIENVKTVSACLTGIRYDDKQVALGLQCLTNEIRATNNKLDSQIATVSDCLVIPSWKAWVYAVLLVVVGVLAGRFL